MIQSLVRRESVADLVAGYGQVIVDECHHLPAASFERVLSIYRRTRNLRAVQLVLGHTKLDYVPRDIDLKAP